MITPNRNIISLTLLSLLTVGLVACQGKNPLDRSNSPTKDYADLKQDSEVFQDLKVEKVDNGQSVCGKVYDMQIHDAAARNLIFVEGEPKAYTLKLRSYIAKNYQLSLVNASDKSIKLQKLDNDGNWSLSWNPPQNTVDRKQGFAQQTLTIGFKPDSSSVTSQAKNCLTEMFIEDFNLTINLNRTQPTLTIDGIKEQIYSSKEKSIKFKMYVTDPASSNRDLPYVSFSKSDWSSPEHKTVELRPICSKARATKDVVSWEFNCDIDLSLIQLTSSTEDHNKIVEGQFYAIGQGVINQTPELKRTIRIQIDNPPAPIEEKAAPSSEKAPHPNQDELIDQPEIPVPMPRPDYKPGDQ